MRSVVLTRLAAILLTFAGGASPAFAEDGYDLWLRYDAIEPAQSSLAARERSIVALTDSSATLQIAMTELERALSSVLDESISFSASATDGSIVLARSADADRLPILDRLLKPVGRDGYMIRSLEIDGAKITLVLGNEDIGILYGVFALLRQLQTGGDIDDLDIASSPRIDRRLLNHWDNLDGSVERGYAGGSIWDWESLPDAVDPRYTDYARANASIGVNGVVLNNVNAQAAILSRGYLEKVAAIAAVLRPYGMRVYLSVSFNSPIEIGGLASADPIEPSVGNWWQRKAEEIYALIPDFGGFLVKADSEGQPGPHGYGRTHAEGANMLAAALRPHGGVVFWRAFVYSTDDAEDRVKQAWREFKPLDGLFSDNVILQVKNGPLDFQPREPFHPLFGAMPNTPLAIELQITQEYLGFATHLAYLGTLWEEVLASDTYAAGPGSEVARIVDGSLEDHATSAIAGVSNIGTDRNWTGATFTQANWYAFGRMAWDPDLDARQIAKEWLRMTFSNEAAFIEPAADMMLSSREAVVDYMTPLGLAHLMGTGHHYGPAPWVDDLSRAEWNPYYYHRATSDFIGFDRTASGSNAVSQYAGPVAERFSELDKVPQEYLLWFHRVSWDHRLASGATVWESLVAHYDRGVAAVESMQSAWDRLEEYVDPQRFTQTADFLAIQRREALWWRDACIAYFADISGRALPEGTREPEHSLDYYRTLSFPAAPGN